MKPNLLSVCALFILVTSLAFAQQAIPGVEYLPKRDGKRAPVVRNGVGKRPVQPLRRDRRQRLIPTADNGRALVIGQIRRELIR